MRLQRTVQGMVRPIRGRSGGRILGMVVLGLLLTGQARAEMLVAGTGTLMYEFGS
jgi:hypothetical protein